MSDDPLGTNDLVVRKTSLKTDQASSRLVRRGLRALDEIRMTPLDVEELAVFGSSVFVFAKQWDSSAWGRYEIPSWRQFMSEPLDQQAEIWNRWRQVTLFEFDRSGKFIRKIELPQLSFTSEGLAKILDRDCVAITIRSNFIYFRENLWMGDYPGADRCDIYYIFSRTGERQAIWSNSKLAHRYRGHQEPKVPVAEWLDPDLIDDKHLIKIAVQDASMGSQYQYSSSVAIDHSISADSKVELSFQDVETWIIAISRYQENTSQPEDMSPVPVATSRSVGVDLALSGSLQYYLNHVTISPDPRYLWLLGDEKTRNDTLQRSIVKLDIGFFPPKAITYTLPHLYELIHRGIVAVTDRNGRLWTPSQADFAELIAKYESQFLDDDDWGDEDEEEKYYYRAFGRGIDYPGRYTLLSSSGDDFIIAAEMKTDAGEEDIDYHWFLHFRINNGEVILVKQLEMVRPETRFWLGRVAFSDEHFYLADTEWNDADAKYEWVIQVIDINASDVKYLRPKVPLVEVG